MQWISHCVQLQIDSVGVFCLGSGPVFGVWFVFCCLLRCFRWRNASLAGGFAGRRFWWLWFPFCWLHRFAYFKDFFVLVQSLVCLLTCKDRAISATSATLEEKKKPWVLRPEFVVVCFVIFLGGPDVPWLCLVGIVLF